MMKVLPRFTHSFATALPELVAPARAAAFPDPRLLVLNDSLAGELGFDADLLRANPGILIGAPEALPHDPVAMVYAGHQFGVFVPRLGDGRALLLGEVGGVDLHLKGSGPTPFSRGGDGYAVIGPMLREYIVSEALHALGIPTSRSLAVTATGMPVRREITLPGAVLARTAASHIRVGTFQYARRDESLLRCLADYAIERHYPHLAGDYLGFYRAVIDAQARLVAHWMGVGFIHGVMNTDNTTISGETIDYGPCAFLDTYDPAAVFSSIDHHGRYAYRNQPAIVQWNLARFGETLLPLIDVEPAQSALEAFPAAYSDAFADVFFRKLGLATHPEEEIITSFLDLLTAESLDFTNSFRALSEGEAPSESEAMREWMTRWSALDPDLAAMRAVNPVYIPRNAQLQTALNNAEDGDMSGFTEMLELVSSPFERRPGTGEYLQGGPGGFRTYCGT